MTTRALELGADRRILVGSASLVLDGGLTSVDTDRDGYAETDGGLVNATVTGQSVETLSMRRGVTAAADLEIASLKVNTFRE